jgi:hypothetical protein
MQGVPISKISIYGAVCEARLRVWSKSNVSNANCINGVAMIFPPMGYSYYGFNTIRSGNTKTTKRVIWL